MGECKIVIPSMSRAKDVLTTKVVDAIICVPESQKDEYKYYNKNSEIITHPDSVKGLSLKRQWILDKFGDVFMLDDDIVSFNKLYIYSGEHSKIKSKNKVYIIIQNTYLAAKDMGVYLWGFCTGSNSLKYMEFKPIQLTGYITGCATGIISGSKYLKYSKKSVAVEDYYISALNAYYHRMIFKDMRYCFVQKDTFVKSGGLALYRNLETEKNDTLFLKRTFGSVIKLKKTTENNGKTKQNIKNPYARSLKIPF